MSTRGPRRPWMAIPAVVLLSAACSATGAGSSATVAPPPTTAAGTVAPGTTAPAAGPSDTGAPSAGPTASPRAAATAAPPSAVSGEPPAASLTVEGGDPIKGQLGSYTWGGGGSDSPWLPGAPLHVGAGERLSFALADGVVVATWTARRIAAGTTDGSGAIALGGGAAPVAFDAPASGSWSVQVAVRFAGDLGSATYYWRLDVD